MVRIAAERWLFTLFKQAARFTMLDVVGLLTSLSPEPKKMPPFSKSTSKPSKPHLSIMATMELAQVAELPMDGVLLAPPPETMTFLPAACRAAISLRKLVASPGAAAGV